MAAVVASMANDKDSVATETIRARDREITMLTIDHDREVG